jgi:hypothetical protein
MYPMSIEKYSRVKNASNLKEEADKNHNWGRVVWYFSKLFLIRALFGHVAARVFFWPQQEKEPPCTETAVTAATRSRSLPLGCETIKTAAKAK